MMKITRKRFAEYLFVLCVLAVIAAIYISVLNGASEFFAAWRERRYDAAREYLKAAGVKGALTVSLLEMLQMIVVFVPAEFVQVSAGLAFPVYVALPVCMFGVFLGSSVIFLIVRRLRLRLSLLEKRSGKIKSFIQRINKNAPMTVIMYILFVTPIIPFGAIAYFASSSDISYRRYALACTTGVIPSILSSCLLGNVMFYCIGRGRGLFIAAVAITAALMAALLLIAAAVLKKRYFVKTFNKPNAVVYGAMYFFLGLYLRLRLKLDKSGCEKLGPTPSLIIGAHTSFYDFYYIAAAAYPRRLNIVANRYYFNGRLTRPLLNALGAIPKSLFESDIETMRLILRASEAGCDLALFPEGRLSPDGTGFEPAGGFEGLAKLIKRLGMPVYFFSAKGGYLASPKWRSSPPRGSVSICLRPVFSGGETLPELTDKLRALFDYDESVPERAGDVDVRGLEKILYRCPGCGAEFTMTSHKNALECGACGRRYVFDGGYISEGMSIAQWYKWQKRELAGSLEQPLSDSCEVRCFDKGSRKMKRAGEGRCELSKNGFIYTGTLLGERVKIEKTPAALQALAFSCGEEFEFYHNGRLLYFYPSLRDSVVKWSAMWDILVDERRGANERR